MAPRKVRVVLDAIREQPVELALAKLKLADRRAAQLVHKLLASAVANMSQAVEDIDLTEVYVKEAYADQGPTIRRFRPRAMGRATRIQKKTSHVTVVVASLD
jgi:large subunit ribosomal protein L22